MWPRLERRAQPSAALRLASPLIALLLTLLGGLVLFAALGKPPLQAFLVFFVHPLRDGHALSELLLKATPLMLIAAGLAIGYRANVWNIGAEGQYVVGALAATAVALGLPDDAHAGWALPAMALAGAAGGLTWAAIGALLRTRFNANEILVTLMLVYVAQFAASWLVYGPWKDPEGFNFPQTALFAESALLPVLVPGTRLTVAFPLALLVLVVVAVFLQRSFTGFQLQVGGQAAAAARYAGYPTGRPVWIGLLSGGALAGLAGMTEVAGPMGQLTTQVSAGYGFAAIIVAFVGRLHPLGIGLAALLMSLLYLGGEQAQQTLNLPASIAAVFQGMLLFFLLASDLFIAYRLRFGWPEAWRRSWTRA